MVTLSIVPSSAIHNAARLWSSFDLSAFRHASSKVIYCTLEIYLSMLNLKNCLPLDTGFLQRAHRPIDSSCPWVFKIRCHLKISTIPEYAGMANLQPAIVLPAERFNIGRNKSTLLTQHKKAPQSYEFV